MEIVAHLSAPSSMVQPLLVQIPFHCWTVPVLLIRCEKLNLMSFSVSKSESCFSWWKSSSFSKSVFVKTSEDWGFLQAPNQWLCLLVWLSLVCQDFCVENCYGNQTAALSLQAYNIGCRLWWREEDFGPKVSCCSAAISCALSQPSGKNRGDRHVTPSGRMKKRSIIFSFRMGAREQGGHYW